LLCAGVFIGCVPPQPQAVVLIVVDTLRADHLGLYGYERPTSPNLDRWSREGVIFEQAFATSPWTLPTFGSILTGELPAGHAAGRRVKGKWKRAPLEESLPTLAEILREEGFTTGAVVSNPFLKPEFGTSRGFETYDYERSRRADAVVDWTLEWLDTAAEQPFFLMMHLIDPHLPYDAPPPVEGRFTAGGRDPRPLGKLREFRSRTDTLSEEEKSFIAGLYDEEIALVDRELGRFLEALEERGLWDRLLVILTSDHGEELFDHAGFEHGHSMYQELLRVPLIVWGPAVRAGREARPVSLLDLAPTIFEAVGSAAGERLPGESLWTVLRSRGEMPDRAILAENTLWVRELKTIVRWPHKLILDPKGGRRRLYDLAADPEEAVDLASGEPQLASRLEEELLGRLSRAHRRSSSTAPAVSDQTLDELRALGYVD
jgi:arylsulfatase A-like enzyme